MEDMRKGEEMTNEEMKAELRKERAEFISCKMALWIPPQETQSIQTGTVTTNTIAIELGILMD